MPVSRNTSAKSRHYITLIFIATLVAGIVIRWAFRDVESGDYVTFLSGWYDTIAGNGGFHALKEPLSNYTPPYLYLLTLATYLPIKKLYAIKLISVIFDFALAWLAYLNVRVKYGPGIIPTLAFSAVFLAPTVMVNSSLWGQCDAIYTTFLLAAVYNLSRLSHKKTWLAVIYLGLAFAFKQQSIFIFPVFLILALRKEIHWTQLLLVPLVYAIAMIPAAAMGRPFLDLLFFYKQQAGSYTGLSHNAPNVFAGFSNVKYNLLGTLSSVAACALIASAGLNSLKNFIRTVSGCDRQIRLSLIVILIFPLMIMIRPVVDLVLIIFRKPSTYSVITSAIPGARDWLVNESGDVFGIFGLCATAVIVVVFCIVGSKYKAKIIDEPETLIKFSLMSTLLMPFFLVRMHERYFFPADIFSILFAFYRPKYFYVPIMVVGVSLLSYFPFLLNVDVVPMPFLSVALALVIVIVLTDLASMFKGNRQSDNIKRTAT